MMKRIFTLLLTAALLTTLVTGCGSSGFSEGLCPFFDTVYYADVLFAFR